MYILLLFTAASIAEGVIFVDRCPTLQGEWKERADKLPCPDGKSYHCLKTMDSRFIEICAWRQGFKSAKGCPVWQLVNNEYQLTQTECFEKEKYCPSLQANETMISDKMYQYPLCISPTDKSAIRKTYTTRKFIPFIVNHSSVQTTTSLAKSDSNSNKATMTYALIGGGVLVAVILLVLFLMVLLQRRRIKSLTHESQRANYMSSVPYNSESSHQYRMERIYDEIEEVDDSYLEPSAPVHKEEVPHRDYEVKMSECKYHDYSKIEDENQSLNDNAVDPEQETVMTEKMPDGSKLIERREAELVQEDVIYKEEVKE